MSSTLLISTIQACFPCESSMLWPIPSGPPRHCARRHRTGERIDRSMSPDEARPLWTDLRLRGWYRASEEEISHHQMSHRKLRRIAYGVK